MRVIYARHVIASRVVGQCGIRQLGHLRFRSYKGSTEVAKKSQMWLKTQSEGE